MPVSYKCLFTCKILNSVLMSYVYIIRFLFAYNIFFTIITFIVLIYSINSISKYYLCLTLKDLLLQKLISFKKDMFKHLFLKHLYTVAIIFLIFFFHIKFSKTQMCRRFLACPLRFCFKTLFIFLLFHTIE